MHVHARMLRLTLIIAADRLRRPLNFTVRPMRIIAIITASLLLLLFAASEVLIEIPVARWLYVAVAATCSLSACCA